MNESRILCKPSPLLGWSVIKFYSINLHIFAIGCRVKPQTQCKGIAIAIEITRFQLIRNQILEYTVSDKLKSCYFYRYRYSFALYPGLNRDGIAMLGSSFVDRLARYCLRFMTRDTSFSAISGKFCELKKPLWIDKAPYYWIVNDRIQNFILQMKVFFVDIRI